MVLKWHADICLHLRRLIIVFKNPNCPVNFRCLPMRFPQNLFFILILFLHVFNTLTTFTTYTEQLKTLRMKKKYIHVAEKILNIPTISMVPRHSVC